MPIRLLAAFFLLCATRVLLAQPLPADATVRRALAADTVIGGIPCAKTDRVPAEFHRASDRLAGCFLSREYAYGAHRFPRGSWLDLNTSGVLWSVWLSTDATLAGHRCRGEGFKKWHLRFFPNGALESCYLTADAVVDGVPCMHGTFLRELRSGGKTALQFTDDGRLRRCTIARDTTIDGLPLKKWTVFKRLP